MTNKTSICNSVTFGLKKTKNCFKLIIIKRFHALRHFYPSPLAEGHHVCVPKSISNVWPACPTLYLSLYSWKKNLSGTSAPGKSIHYPPNDQLSLCCFLRESYSFISEQEKPENQTTTVRRKQPSQVDRRQEVNALKKGFKSWTKKPDQAKKKLRLVEEGRKINKAGNKLENVFWPGQSTPGPKEKRIEIRDSKASQQQSKPFKMLEVARQPLLVGG